MAKLRKPPPPSTQRPRQITEAEFASIRARMPPVDPYSHLRRQKPAPIRGRDPAEEYYRHEIWKREWAAAQERARATQPWDEEGFRRIWGDEMTEKAKRGEI
jgi:hypothetical protein